MISTSKDNDGKVLAYIEWRLVGQSGFDKLNGEYVWINDFWIHEDYRNGYLFRDLVNKILFNAPNARWCYFTRQKYGGRKSRLYTRERFMKLSEKWLVLI